jgi:hypothetical protein
MLLTLTLGQGAGTAPASTSGLDQKKIHADYNEGNFDKVTSDLEKFMASRKEYGLDDSIFIAKHLAVVYSANPKTREKGKYFMYRLLALLPSAKLVDMYVSDEIDRIFDKVREEYMTRQKSFGVDTAKVSVPSKAPASSERETAAAQAPAPEGSRIKAGDKGEAGGKRTAIIVAGGVAIVALGAVAYFALGDEPEAVEKTYVVP